MFIAKNNYFISNYSNTESTSSLTQIRKNRDKMADWFWLKELNTVLSVLEKRQYLAKTQGNKICHFQHIKFII